MCRNVLYCSFISMFLKKELGAQSKATFLFCITQ